MDQTQRFRRPVPERTKPRRNVLGALGQSDPMLNDPRPEMAGGDPAGHPLGPGFGTTNAASTTPPNPADPAGLIDAGVRAASDLVDEHIRQGEETARSLGKAVTGISLAQTDVSGLVTGLVRAYSDVASGWVDLVASLAQKVEGTGHAPPPPTSVTSHTPGFGLLVRSSVAAETEIEIEMFRPADQVRPQPLASTDTPPAPPINDVHHDPGKPGTAGKLCVAVPAGQPAGTYHGLLLAAADQSPVGVLTLRILPPSDTGTAE